MDCLGVEEEEKCKIRLYTTSLALMSKLSIKAISLQGLSRSIDGVYESDCEYKWDKIHHWSMLPSRNNVGNEMLITMSSEL